MTSDHPLHIAIVGGGLCGVALAVSLQARNISFTLYESRPSFTEIGAGINLGPSALRALRLISPPLGDKVYSLATRNPVPEENTWMDFYYGAPAENRKDGEILMKLHAPPTGNLSVHRQEFLATLAEDVKVENVKFGKKFVGYTKDDQGVEMEFADGSKERASIVIGCDGIHSKVRAAMFGQDSIFSKPSYANAGCYRAVVPMEKALGALGESARHSQVILGPRGYLVMYPVSGGKFMNCGAWPGEKGPEWGDEWVKPNQYAQFVEDFKDWGERAKKVLDCFAKDVNFWGSYQHIHQPEHFQDGRVLLIGDGAHAMPPHQGSGAAQAAEDAYIVAEVLAELDRGSITKGTVEAALRAIEEVRKPRFSRVHHFSSDSGPRFFNFFNLRLAGEELDQWEKVTKDRLEEIWGIDLIGEAEKAKQIMQKLIQERRSAA